MRINTLFAAVLIAGTVSLAWAKTDDAVREGIGWGDAVVGKTRQQIAQTFGVPEVSETNWYSYRSRRGIDFLFGPDAGDGVTEVRFNAAFAGRGKLSTGIGIGNSLADVQLAYGPIIETRSVAPGSQSRDLRSKVLYRMPGTAKLVYGSTGVLFWFDASDRVSQFVVFVPRMDRAPNGSQ
ncbi:MAG: hypothetical protein ACLQVA_09465 [Candidatus Brocadiia bacterium]